VDEFLSWRWDSYDNAKKTVCQFMKLNAGKKADVWWGDQIVAIPYG